VVSGAQAGGIPTLACLPRARSHAAGGPTPAIPLYSGPWRLRHATATQAAAIASLPQGLAAAARRYLAKRFPSAEVTGITISPEQQKRATELAAERGLTNAKFELCDALNMKYEGEPSPPDAPAVLVANGM
jgi:D-arabinose 1-dehydrogenase-like Zn-dependent alcohol dehydrogenase